MPTQLIRVGLPQALGELGRVDVRALLERSLAVAGPLENLAPGHVERFLALADEAGAEDIRRAIVEAPRRKRAPDPSRPTAEHLLAETRDLNPEAVVEMVGEWPIRDGAIPPPFPAGRRVAKTRAKLLADLASDRPSARQIAAARACRLDGRARDRRRAPHRPPSSRRHHPPRGRVRPRASRRPGAVDVGARASAGR